MFDMSFLSTYFHGKSFLYCLVVLFACCLGSFAAMAGVIIGARHKHLESSAVSSGTVSSPEATPSVVFVPGFAPVNTDRRIYAASHLLITRGIQSPTPQDLLVNSIGFGVPAALFFIMRMVNCIWILRKMHTEDWIMIPTFCFFVSLLILINVSALYATNLYPPGQQDGIMQDPTDVSDRVYGSKIVVGLEQCMIATTWGVKICIWFFLLRLCRQLPNFIRALRILLTYIVVGFLVIEIYYYGIMCRPFSQYWAMPVENEQCATYAHYSIVQAAFNISSDAGLILVPCYMFYISRLSLKRKCLLMVVFSMAVFTIVAAILNKYFNFASPTTTTYQVWYIREAGVSQIVGNLICCWQLFQKVFKLKTFDERSNEIVANPEMERRPHLGNPEAYSVGGSPKDTKWFFKKNAAREHLGSFLSKATTTNASRLTGSTMVDDKLYAKEAGGKKNESVPPTTLMTLNRDGDDATLAINYSVANNIV